MRISSINFRRQGMFWVSYERVELVVPPIEKKMVEGFIQKNRKDEND
jgi:hypothetical protein